MKYNGAEIVIKLLEDEGVEYISGIPGGFNLPLYDALYKSKITHILARHEQGAGFIAQGMARTTGKVGVCFATSGPGATNLLTAIADAKLDSIPLVAITGQVPLSAIGTDAFQEVDAYGLTIPITKHNFLIRSIDELFKIIPEAFNIALEGRPGPVLIDIPKNIQTQVIDLEDFPSTNNSFIVKKSSDSSTLKSIANSINDSKKPILYAGGGVVGSEASENLFKLAKKSSIPVTLSLMGLSAFPANDELNIGMLGMHGAAYTNYLMNEADLIVALGIRFDDRATGKIEEFCPNAKIIHIDIDPSEINKVKPTNISMVANAKDFIEDLLPLINDASRDNWISEVKDYRSKYPLPSYTNPMHPANIIPFVASKVPVDAIIATDVGEHQMWTAQRYPFQTPRSFITSGGLGTMGFGLPAAIGAAFVNPEKLVISFSGDGSILMNIQELATLSEFGLNVKVIILNNHHLGLVRQQQELFYHKHYIASCFIGNPDFKTIARGFGMNSYDLSEENDPLERLGEILCTPGPCLINIPIDETEKVLPMVAPGASNMNMIGGAKND
jgi:acetolactate synthase-1/2/3 large subunit